MEKETNKNDFLKLLKNKQRTITYTEHSIKKAKMRQFIQNENEIRTFEMDITEKEPYKVVEQECETKDERKFKAYYPSDLGGFSCYIFVIDGEIRLVSLYRTTKKLQQRVYGQLYKYQKEKEYR